MANSGFFKKILIHPVHLPTAMLLIGFPVYWLEMYVLRAGHPNTSPLATILFSLYSVAVLFHFFSRGQKTFLKVKNVFWNQPRTTKFLFGFGVCVAVFILFCGLKASLLPPHLVQEFDALNYHITMARQHLIRHSFRHIPWATADLYFMPLDFALAPYWLATQLPNKFPQFLFFIGLIGVAARLVNRLTKGDVRAAGLLVLMILGSHNVAIQMGTAMLDVPMCYLLLASLDSFLTGAIFLAAVEFAFYFWAKSFIPVQMVIIGCLLGGAYLLMRRPKGIRLGWNAGAEMSGEEKGLYLKKGKGGLVWFLVISVAVAGPFLAKSLYYAGTPLYPFFPGMVSVNTHIDKKSVAWQSLLEKTEQVLKTKDQYGSDRSVKAFLEQFWLIAVPEKGVNNRYDYPVGLIYLLCLGPFFYTLVKSLRERRFLLLPLFIAAFWWTWWLGSHQSRFLFVPILLLFITVASQPRFLTQTFLACVVLSTLLVAVSVFRAHRMDWGRRGQDVLREKDKKLLEMAAKLPPGQTATLHDYDAAFAAFPVNVVKKDSVFVLQY